MLAIEVDPTAPHLCWRNSRDVWIKEYRNGNVLQNLFHVWTFEYRVHIRSSWKRWIRLVQFLLEWARPRRARLDLEVARFDLQLIQDLRAALTGRYLDVARHAPDFASANARPRLTLSTLPFACMLRPCVSIINFGARRHRVNRTDFVIAAILSATCTSVHEWFDPLPELWTAPHTLEAYAMTKELAGPWDNFS